MWASSVGQTCRIYISWKRVTYCRQTGHAFLAYLGLISGPNVSHIYQSETWHILQTGRAVSAYASLISGPNVSHILVGSVSHTFFSFKQFQHTSHNVRIVVRRFTYCRQGRCFGLCGPNVSHIFVADWLFQPINEYDVFFDQSMLHGLFCGGQGKWSFIL